VRRPWSPPRTRPTTPVARKTADPTRAADHPFGRPALIAHRTHARTVSSLLSLLDTIDHRYIGGAMTTKPPLLADRGDLRAVLGFGAAVILWTATTLVLELARVVPNRDVRVDVLLTDLSVDLPVGPGGAPVAAVVDSAALTVPHLSAGTYVATLGAVVVPRLVTIAITVCVLLLCRRMLAGQFFSTTATRLITAISLLIALSWLLTWLLATISANGVLAAVAERDPLQEVSFQVGWTPLLAAMAVGALAAAFRAGERMQRDSEGLV
jgi:hypothetical protein